VVEQAFWGRMEETAHFCEEWSSAKNWEPGATTRPIFLDQSTEDQKCRHSDQKTFPPERSALGGGLAERRAVCPSSPVSGVCRPGCAGADHAGLWPLPLLSWRHFATIIARVRPREPSAVSEYRQVVVDTALNELTRDRDAVNASRSFFTMNLLMFQFRETRFLALQPNLTCEHEPPP
jgi:hypothetical protein